MSETIESTISSTKQAAKPAQNQIKNITNGSSWLSSEWAVHVFEVVLEGSGRSHRGEVSARGPAADASGDDAICFAGEGFAHEPVAGSDGWGAAFVGVAFDLFD